jgi:urease subunit alpha
MVIKGGMINWSLMGDVGASVTTAEPIYYRPSFGSLGSAMPKTSVSFVSAAAHEAGVADRLALQRQVVPVERTRTITKRDLVRNDTLPAIDVDPETFAVTVDGKQATVSPAESISMNRLVFFS